MSNLSTMEFSLLENVITIVFLSIIIGVTVWAVAQSLYRKFMGNLRTVEAIVLVKTIDSYVSQPVFVQDKQVSTGLVEKGLLYKVLFKASDDSELSFSVSKKLYEQLSEGQSGKLTYKGEQLIRFGNFHNTPLSQGGEFKSIKEVL